MLPTQATVYLVDDDDAVRDSLKTLLESCGLTVRDYSSAPDFLAAGGSPEPACLVLDLHLPVISGLDLLAMMRQRGILLPVVLITGRSDKETRDRALRGGAVAFLEKPVREDALLVAIETALARQRPSEICAPRQGVSPSAKHQAT